MEKELSIYLHFPFCKQKCFYCDFNSYSGIEELMPAYGEGLISEISRYLPQRRMISSVFFGGGTPSYFPTVHLADILKFIKERFFVTSQTEITIEVNPGTITVEELIWLKQAGFNRLSLGLQATQDELLKTIGRIHSWQEFVDIYEMTREIGFANLGVDLIFGLPGQTSAHWQHTLQRVVELNPEHISAYGLQLETGTPLEKLIDAGHLILPDEDEAAKMMQLTMEYLPQCGYEQYEISNYAKPGYQSVHNIGYWTGRNYLGFGAGASSTLYQDRWMNIKDPRDYLLALKNGDSLVASRETISSSTAAIEAIMLGLRMRSGVNLQKFKYHFRIDLLQKAEADVEIMLKRNLIVLNDGWLALTNEGVLISNQVIGRLVRNL